MAGRKIKRNDTTPPQNPEVGRLWYDQALSQARRWNGKEWAFYHPGDLAKLELQEACDHDFKPLLGGAFPIENRDGTTSWKCTKCGLGHRE